VTARARPDWDAWALGIADAVAKRGDCTRRQVGAVLLDQDHRVIGCGYNGGPAGGESCLAGECPRGRHYELAECPGKPHPPDCLCRVLTGRCACGEGWPCNWAVPPGSSYDTGPGVCIAVHAEMNALLDVSDRSRLVGATMYITDQPCGGCLKILKNTQIKTFVWPGGRIG
jgi:dCMP deaminase